MEYPIVRDGKTVKINITTTVRADLHKLAQEKDIAWTDALEFGIRFLLADTYEFSFDYPQNKLSSKVISINQQLSKTAQELARVQDLLKEQGIVTDPEPKSVEDDFKEAGLQ